MAKKKNNLGTNYDYLDLKELYEKVSNNNLLTLDELLILSRIHLVDLFSTPEFYDYRHIVFCLFEDFFYGLYDKVIFENDTVNLVKLKLIITRFDRSVSDYHGYEENLEGITDEDFDRKLGEFNLLRDHLILLINNMNVYCPEYAFVHQLDSEELIELKKETEKVDTRVSTKAPTNQERIKALKYLAPELWEKLQKQQSKPLQQDVIHLITGVNKVDSYKYSFGDRQNQAEEKEIPNLTDLVNKLTQS